MPNTTSRLALVEPLTTDAPNELRTAITTNATTLDTSVLVTSGTLASRPATPSPNVVGVTYYATDTVQWFFWDGSAWIVIQAPGAWSALTLGTNVSAVGGYYTLSARVAGDRVQLKGTVQTAAGYNGSTLATLPAGLRPSATASISSSANSAIGTTVSTAGVISTTATGAFFIGFDGSGFALA